MEMTRMGIEPPLIGSLFARDRDEKSAKAGRPFDFTQGRLRQHSGRARSAELAVRDVSSPKRQAFMTPLACRE